MVLGIKPPLNVHNLFDNWYPGKDKTFRSLLLTGAAAICWSIWLIRNEVVFFIEVDQKLFCRFYPGEHIGFGSGHTCNGPRYRRSLFWRGLPQDGECGYAFFFASYGWPFTFRIEF